MYVFESVVFSAPKWKVVKVDLADESFSLSDVIPEAPNTLTSVGPVAGGSLLFVEYIVDVVDRLYIYDTKTCQPVKVVKNNFQYSKEK